MKPTTKPKRLLATSALSVLVISSLLAIAADAPEQTKHREPALARIVPLSFGSSIPLAVESAGIEWQGKTYHLVKLGSVQFDLDKTDRLKADIQAEVTGFDDVDYDISGAVLDAAGQMLGTARAQCKVERMWAGRVMRTARTVSLDFGVSLDYARATVFMLSVSKRKVLTPDDWQK